jgi:peptide/nickel transport system substrate-binding protein
MAVGISVTAAGHLLAACGSDDTGGGSSGSTAKADPNGVIIFGNAEPHTSAYWDPHAQFGLADLQVWSLVYDTLLNYDEQGQLTGGIAKRWSRTDPKTLRLELNTGIAFHDGTPLTPEDIKVSIERVSDPDSGLVLSSYSTPGMVVSVIDDQTIDIATPEPFGPLESVLTIFAVVPAKDVAAPKIFEERPMGSGPYRFVSYEGDTTVLEANTDYWRGKPANAGVELRYIPNTEARQNALVTDQIDVHTRSSSFTLDAIQGKEGYTVSKVGPASQFLYIPQFNTELGDVRVRQAVAHAIDREAIAKSLIQIDPPATSSISAAAAGHIDCTPQFEFDPDKARQLLADAGLADGFAIQMASSNLIAHQPEIDQLVKSQLEDVGIKVNIKTLETGTFRSTYNKYGLSFNSLATLNPDPDSLMSFYRPPITEYAMHMTDPKITELLEKTRTTTGEERQTAIEAWQQYMWENQMMIYTTDDNFHTVAGPQVPDYRRTPQFGEHLVWQVSKQL